jgi:PAS domain S-box-containing protein
MNNDQSNAGQRKKGQRLLNRLALLPIPLLLVAIAVLWAADLQVAWPSPFLYWLVHYGSATIGIVFIAIPAARSFLANGQPSVLMLGCGVLMMEVGVAFMPTGTARSTSTGFAIYNTSVLLSALCHFAGVAINSRSKTRLRHSGAWLTAAYSGCIAVIVLVIWLALTGSMPVFFIDGQGGTLLRTLVVSAAVALFLLTSGLLWQTNRRRASPFLRWYALGLVLLAAGLCGSMLIVVKDSPLQWVTRYTQLFGMIYMCVAILASARASNVPGIPLTAVEDAWQEKEFLAGLRQQTPLGFMLRYGLAVAAVAAGMGLRLVLTAWAGPGLSTYLTFFPAVMMVAMLAGFGPGLAATALADFVVGCWVIPPIGQFSIASPVDRLGLVIFTSMGLFMSVIAELYRRNRRKAEAYDRELALRESERRYRTLFDSIQEGFYLGQVLFNDDGNPCDFIYQEINPAFGRMLGLRRDEIVGRRVKELIPSIKSSWLEVFGTVQLKGEPTRHDSYSEQLQKHFEAFVFRPEQGQFAVLVTDVTARKQAEEAKQAALDRFYTALANMTFATLLVNEDGRIDFANQAFCDIFNLNESPADMTTLTSREVLERIRPAYLNPDEALAHIVEIVDRGLLVQDEEVPMLGGRTFLRDFIPIRLGDNKCGRLWIQKEITDRKRAEEALRERERLLQTLIDGSTSPIFLKDLDGKFITINGALEKMLGISREEIKGKTDYDIASKEVADYWRTHDKQVMAAGKPIQVEEVADLQDGHHIFLANKFPLVDADGQIYGIASISHDITERKRVEEELYILNQTLEDRVTERTLEAEQRALQLRQLAAELTLAEQRERQRISLVLHDGLQQILVAAKFQIALLGKTKDVPKLAAELTEMIDNGIETSRSLTAELSPPILRQGGLVPALEWLVGWMRDKHGLTVRLASHVKIESAPEEVVILLFQSVRELLFNTAKHAGVRTARVEVMQEAGRIRVLVEDEGRGFDPIQLTKEGAKSRGMGLFSIQERLSYLGGSMKIDSAPGRGSRFELTTPPISLEAGVSPIDKQPLISIALTSQKEVKGDSEKRLRVILVDDHMVMRQGLSGLLRAEPDIEIIGEASDGQSAIDLIRELRPDVVLMDISMPGMDGIQATRIIHKELPEVRIIGLSMFQEGEQQAAMREAGAVAYLTKTGPSEALIGAIRACVRISGESLAVKWAD